MTHEERARVFLDCEPDTIDRAECMVVRTPAEVAEQFREVEREAWLACDGHAYLRDQIRELRQALRSAPAPAPLTLKWGLAYADWCADIRGRVVDAVTKAIE